MFVYGSAVKSPPAGPLSVPYGCEEASILVTLLHEQ